MPVSAPYILLAIPNLNRAGTFRQGVVDACRLEPVLVRDGDAALQEVARRGAPALVIIDLSLPKVDGFAVIRKIRRQSSDAETRIIAVAAHDSLIAAARSLAASLAISNVLPLDVNRVELAAVLAAEVLAFQRPGPAAAPAAGTTGWSTDRAADCIADVIDRAAIDARRRSRMSVSIGYVKVGEDERLTFHITARNEGPAMSVGEVAEFKFLRQVADGADPLVLPNVEEHPVFAQLLLKGARPIRGFAAVPVNTSRDDVRAALCVLDTKPITLTAADIDHFMAFAREVGLEIERSLSPQPEHAAIAHPRPATEANAEDIKTLQQLAATDPLTGLANRRGGEKHIANEISRAKRERRPLSCILLDIDRFKQVNDTFGHQAGDQLLHDISNVLRRAVRGYDILVRWGGEEFLMVLPGVDLDMARVLAERVRIAVESMGTHGIGPVTISAGVAKFESDYDFAATLKSADRRLYQAKEAGRNQVV